MKKKKKKVAASPCARNAKWKVSSLDTTVSQKWNRKSIRYMLVSSKLHSHRKYSQIQCGGSKKKNRILLTFRIEFPLE